MSPRRLVGGALVLLALMGCAVDLRELGPFPCAADSRCPDGLACLPEVGCAPARLDVACDETTDCSTAATGARCVQGMCALACQDGKGCPTGRVCSVLTGSGVCLQQCTSPSGCESGQECRDLGYQSFRGCAPPHLTIPRCQSVTTEAQCTLCQPRYWTVTCAGGQGFCPMNSTCQGNECLCNPGFTAVTCNGTPCTSGQCSYPNYWCRPNSPLSATCQDEPLQVAGSCRCKDGRTYSLACGTTSSCEERCDKGCDTVQQDCAASTDKCSLLLEGTEQVSRCTRVTGQGAVGQSCTRSAYGVDSCGKGLFCSRVATPRNALACRKLCHQTSDCVTGERCVDLGGRLPPEGICLETGCALFSTQCGTGRACGVAAGTNGSTLTYCRYQGPVETGGTCATDSDCAGDAFCSGDKCVRLCDASHACPSGTRCHAQTGLPNAGGLCLP
jgi:hypothetical protein